MRHPLRLPLFLLFPNLNSMPAKIIDTITADFNEAFTYDDSEPELAVLDSQRATARKLADLTARATSPLERDRIG